MRFVELGNTRDDGTATRARFADDLGPISLSSIAGVLGVIIDARIPPRTVAIHVDEAQFRTRPC
jgi:hypothetical protein